MRVLIMRAMRGEFPSMDVYSDGLSCGLREAFPDWQIEEIEPAVLRNEHLGFRLARAVVGCLRYVDRFVVYPLRALRRKADVIHVVSDHYFHVARFPRLRGQKVVATCHDLIYYRFWENIEQFAKFVGISRKAQEFCMESLKFCDHVITLSQDNRRDLQEILGVSAEKITIVHNAVPAHFRPPVAGEREMARRSLELPEDRFVLMHVGTVEPRKNIDTILKALVLLKGQPFVFLKVGIEFTPAQREFIDRNSIGDMIRHVGKVPNLEMPRIYHASDALLFPSLYEGFPFPIGEAMASGTPVITSTESSLPEVAGGAAQLVAPLDAGSIADACRRFREDSGHCASLVESGLRRVRLLTWRENGRQVGEIYRRVTETPR